MLRATASLLCAVQASGLVLSPARGARGVDGSLCRASAAHMAAPVDDEGNSVMEAVSGGPTLQDLYDQVGQEASQLSAEKQAMCVLKKPEWNVNKMALSATDEDFVLQTSSMGDATCEIVIDPPFNTYEDYVVGFTAESSDKISIVREESSDIEGRTERRGGEPLVYKIKYEPQGQEGLVVAHLCCIYPEEKMYSKFYEIKGVTDGAAADLDATRDSSPDA